MGQVGEGKEQGRIRAGSPCAKPLSALHLRRIAVGFHGNPGTVQRYPMGHPQHRLRQGKEQACWPLKLWTNEAQGKPPRSHGEGGESFT